VNVQGWPKNPASRLEAAFRAIRAERMRGLPFVNEALEVEAVGFAPWDAHWLGILLTPWFMNLILLPRDAAGWQSVAPGDKLAYRFPAGVYDFVSGREDAIGEYQACSLFSPMFEFADHVSARLAAEAALQALFDPANCDTAYAPPAGRAPMSKREFLRGAVPGGGREPGG
jgi:[NiFe] hydrogenase assembly HybE family chaperone